MPQCQRHDFEESPTVDEPLIITGPGEDYLNKTSPRSALDGWAFAIKLFGCVLVVGICLMVSSCASKRYIIPSPPEARAAGNVPPLGFKPARNEERPREVAIAHGPQRRR
jgi:hypothetical protein